MKEKVKVPELRFDGFTDDWEERKLGDVGNTFTGLTGKTKEDFGHGSAKFVTYVNVFQNPIATLDQLDAIEIDEKQNQVQKGDIFFTTSSETPEEVGMSSVWTHDTENVYLNSFTFGYRPRVSFDLNYMASMLRSPSIRKKIMFLAQGISRYNISKTKMLEIEIPTPTLSEQEKIGSFFKQLDNTIALHQRKLDLLKEQKKGYLQKMFPKNVEKVPELRFAGFADDWEERKFSDFTKLSQGLQIAISDRFTEAGPNKEFYITNEFLNPNNTKKYYIENPSKNVIANTNDILMTRTGNTGKVVTNTKGAFHNNFFKIDYDPKKISKLFLYFLLTSIPIQKEILIRAGTSTIPDLNHKDFYKIKVYLPIFEEQQRIGSFFKQLDDTIALHQRKLDLLKEQKKGFLQKMFV
ncbi:restriction endonuclease subunit S [Lactococcus lactis]|uniref:Type IC HsdS subunit n=1 Tax=Lactococcus lactis subsp. lactis A12 TaxID=1137134 RepID=S6FTS2_LACLL|nr:restriction endonuclease subunit S [Lactococcus lactis]CDG04847.1 Putative type IC HsdS subunit [Lactococcus lactis subsp. lactis A12]SBW30872.1 Putative type IC HsdS subunit [Lactococcus lactis subsp. lactis]